AWSSQALTSRVSASTSFITAGGNLGVVEHALNDTLIATNPIIRMGDSPFCCRPEETSIQRSEPRRFRGRVRLQPADSTTSQYRCGRWPATSERLSIRSQQMVSRMNLFHQRT